MTTSSIMLRDLLVAADLEMLNIIGTVSRNVTEITQHANRSCHGGLFVAIRGSKYDGHHYVSDAVERGVRTVIVEESVPEYPNVTQIRVPSTRKALGQLAHAYYGFPSRDMTVAAVTGTNGKTSTAWMMQSIFQAAGIKAATVGTLGTIWDGDGEIMTENTTPDALTIARSLDRMRRDGIQALAIEASSHGIHQYRIQGLDIDSAALTNITHDHLDYHGTFENYSCTKQRLFTEFLSKDGGAIFNLDDDSGLAFHQQFAGRKFGYSTKNNSDADITIREVFHRIKSTDFTLVIEGKALPISLPLIGEFTVSNAAAAAGMAHQLGVPAEYIQAGINQVKPVPGRFEPIDAGQPFLVAVDYAHTPDALSKTLKTARRLSTGNLICVFGCGGDRDAHKRPLMAEVVDHFADIAIITSDNPRNEDPFIIAKQAKSGFKQTRHEMILDRALAIEKALYLAKPGDAVMICGKGHEAYQEILGERLPFDDREVATSILNTMRENWFEPKSSGMAVELGQGDGDKAC